MTKIQKYSGGSISQALQEPRLGNVRSQDINTFLLKIYFLLGISEANRPDLTNQKLLIDLFRVEFNDYTLKEIELAFTLARKGMIDYNLKLYDRPFSIQFVADLMIVYRRYRNDHNDYKNYIKLPEETEPTEQEIFIKMRKMVLSTFEKFKKNNDDIREITYTDYNFIERYSFLFSPNLEQKQKAMNEASISIANEDNESKKWSIATKGIIAATRDKAQNLDNKQRVVNRAKELIVIDYFKNLIEMDMDLELSENLEL